MTRLAAKELHDRSRYEPVWAISHADVASALRPYMLARSWVSGVYVAANLAALGVVAVAWSRSDLPGFDAFANACLGMCLGFVLLLPVHEWLHALAYRSLGAGEVRVVYQWRSLTAYCAADHFVAGRWELAWVCVAPFAVLNPVLAAASLLAPGVWAVMLAGALLLHIGACSGDCGLMNWLWLCGPPGTLSYDDVAGRQSYFFAPAQVPAAEPSAAADAAPKAGPGH